MTTKPMTATRSSYEISRLRCRDATMASVT
jgi:hypothetical protein